MCGLKEDLGIVENIWYKSCGDLIVVVEVNNGVISLFLFEEINGKKIVVIISSIEYKMRWFKWIFFF